jgi:3-oxoacyl-[acyl-carrier-protein] synthase-3
MFIRCHKARTVLVIGAETFSRLLDWNDRTTCVLFGDGAGAVIVTAKEGTGTNADRGILTTHLHSDGRYKDKLYVDGGPSSTQTTGHVRMDGREVFKHAIINIANTINEALIATGLTAIDIDWFVPHQANRRILDGIVKRTGLLPDSVIITVGEHGNTSAASVPLALDIASQDGRIKRGDLVLLEAMGGGFTWGSVLVRW